MKKLNGLRIDDYEIVDEIVENDDEYEYEETTIEELLDKTNVDKKEFVNKYNAINIHFMLADETFEKAKRLIDKRFKDNRISKMNAIVFLSLKKKGRAETRYTQLSQKKFNEMVKLALDNNVAIGFDSCSAFKFLKSVNGDKKFETFIEPCESGLFSSYFNVKAEFFPCSFMEGIGDWKTGIKLDDIKNFNEDLWNSKRVIDFRNQVISCRNRKGSCIHYEI